jgi:hydroxymethylbilane synthase
VQAGLSVSSKIQIIRTSGDRIQDRSLQNQDTTGFFTKEIEDRLLDGSVDVAVHSLKDLPTDVTPALELAAFLPRASAEDLLIIHPDWHDPQAPLALRPGCVVGTGALRRQAQLAHHAAHCRPGLLRGNVPTRVERCRSGDYGAIILARAGVERLSINLADLVAYVLAPTLWLPAPSQGIVAVQCRSDDPQTREALAVLDHAASRAAAMLERTMLRVFEAGCHSAFGALARPAEETDRWSMRVGWDDRGTWRTGEITGSHQELLQISREELLDHPAAGQGSVLEGPYAP